MLRRCVLRSLVLAGILLACFAHLVWNGRRAMEIVGENLPSPRLSSGYRDVDLWHPTASFGRVYDLIFWPAGPGGKRAPAGAHLKIQLASGGRTRLVVVRRGHPNTDVPWRDILLGRERLQIVPDRGWIDLGPLPEGEERFDFQVSGLLPGPFGFAEPYQPHRDHFSGFRIRRPDSPLAAPARYILRYRFVSPAPVAAGETLARFFFFISCSRVLQVTGILALALLFAGWFWLWESRYARAVACLVPALTLLHVCGLAPLQGEDEATHAGTVEAVVFSGGARVPSYLYTGSMRAFYQRIGYDDWVGSPDKPVSALLPSNRAALRTFFREGLTAEAALQYPQLTDAYVLDPQRRAPLFYNSFRLFAPALRRLSILDRVSAYVVLSSLASLAFFLAGLFLLTREAPARSALPAYGLVALWPYSVGIVASCSNYSPAIGIGQFLAACAVAAILSAEPGRRLALAGIFSIVSAAGIAVWDDFVFLALPSLGATVILAAARAWKSSPRAQRRIAAGAIALAGIVATAALGWAVASGRARSAVSSLGARLPKELGGFGDPSFWLLVAVAAAPVVTALVLVLSILRSRAWTSEARERAARARTGIAALVFLGLFVATRWSRIPFETVRFDYPDEVWAHWTSFWSNNLAFDQDMLSWQMYFGVFGYPDVSYPMVLYAVSRWALVALLVSLPLLSWRFTERDPERSAALLSLAGLALAACLVTNSIRYFQPSNPWGRYVLPVLPLAALPVLVRVAAIDVRSRAVRAAVALLVALHLWTAVTLQGTRYALGA